MLMRCRRVAAVVFAMLMLASTVGAAPQRKSQPPEKPGAAAKPTPPPKEKTAPATPEPAPETKPYDPQLMRLAEILGALTYLRGLCGAKDADAWRQRMQALLDAEGTPAVRKERLAGAYNRGIQDYSLSYRTCTPNAHAVIERFLVEGERIAKEVENRYRAT